MICILKSDPLTSPDTISNNTTPNHAVTIKTSKEWVLPPRPKPGRKPCDLQKDKKKKNTVKKPLASIGSNHNHIAPINPDVSDMVKNISIVEKENCQLKQHLLGLIHEYKHLRKIVLSELALPAHMTLETTSSSRKRSFTEANDFMTDLVNDMNDLSYSTPVDDNLASPEPGFFNFINYDDDLEEDNEYMDSPPFSRTNSALSRTTSPSSDFDNSLMTSLTRSTTVSTNNSILEKKPFKFYDLPNYSTDEYTFKFDKMNSNDEKMQSIIQEDKYNMITDILEEKLITNDLNYYEEQKRHM